MTDDLIKARIAKAKRAQDYDPDPPRCFNCVYFRRGAPRDWQLKKRKRRERPSVIVDECTFGNFPVSYKGICNEWRNRAGESLADNEACPVVAEGQPR